MPCVFLHARSRLLPLHSFPLLRAGVKPISNETGTVDMTRIDEQKQLLQERLGKSGYAFDPWLDGLKSVEMDSAHDGSAKPRTYSRRADNEREVTKAARSIVFSADTGPNDSTTAAIRGVENGEEERVEKPQTAEVEGTEEKAAVAVGQELSKTGVVLKAVVGAEGKAAGANAQEERNQQWEWCLRPGFSYDTDLDSLKGMVPGTADDAKPEVVVNHFSGDLVSARRRAEIDRGNAQRKLPCSLDLEVP